MPRAKPKSISAKGAPVQVRAIDFVMYNAKHLAPTRAFYQKLFGFKRGHEWHEGWSEFDTEPVTLCLNRPPTKRDSTWDWRGACVALAVDDVPAAIATCRKRGVKILVAPVETRVC